MPERPEAIVAGKNRPFTGAEFLESLRDGREIYIYGERVKDVTTHPAFRNSAASVALLYDALHDKAYKDVLTAPTDTGSGGYTHKFFKAARSREEVIAQRDAIAAWARLSQARARSRALSQPCSGQPTDRPQQAGRAGQGRLHHDSKRNRRRHLCLRRQGGGDQFHAHAI